MSEESREYAKLFDSLNRQRVWARIFLFVVYFGSWVAMRVYARYRIPRMRAVRRQFREICKTHDGPLLICPNHLTMVDSAIVMWALACLLYTSPSPRDLRLSRMPSSA